MEQQRPNGPWPVSTAVSFICHNLAAYICPHKIDLTDRLSAVSHTHCLFFGPHFASVCPKIGSLLRCPRIRAMVWSLIFWNSRLSAFYSSCHSPECQRACWTVLCPRHEPCSHPHDSSSRNSAALHLCHRLVTLPHKWKKSTGWKPCASDRVRVNWYLNRESHSHQVNGFADTTLYIPINVCRLYY